MTNPRSDRFSLAAISRDNPGRRRLKIRGLSFVLIKLQLSPYPLNRYSGHRGLSSVYPSIHPTIRCKNRPLSPVSTPFPRVSKNFLPHPYLQIKFSPPMIEDLSNPIFSTDFFCSKRSESGTFTFLRKREENVKNFIEREKIDTRIARRIG